MKYEVLSFSTRFSLCDLQKDMNEFFEKYSESIEVIDVSYHTGRYDIRLSGSEYNKSGDMTSELVTAMITIKNLKDLDLSEFH